MKKIKKIDIRGAQSVSAFGLACYCSCSPCVTCSNCKSSSQVTSLQQSASSSYHGINKDTLSHINVSSGSGV